MSGSEDRVLVTHVGSVPRNPALRELLVRQDRGEPVDARELKRQAGGGMAARDWRPLRPVPAAPGASRVTVGWPPTGLPPDGPPTAGASSDPRPLVTDW